MHVSIQTCASTVTVVVETNDDVHTTSVSARIRNTTHTRIELTENNDNIHADVCPHHTTVHHCVNGSLLLLCNVNLVNAISMM